VASVVALVALGSVENKNKMLAASEKVIYHQRMLQNLAVFLVVAVSLGIF